MSLLEKCSGEQLVLLAGRLRGIAAQKTSAAKASVTLGQMSDDVFDTKSALQTARTFIDDSNDVTMAADLLAELAEAKRATPS